MDHTDGAADRAAGLEAGRAWGARHHSLFTLKRLARLLPDPPGGPPSWDDSAESAGPWAEPWAGPDEGLAGDADADATVRRRLAGDRMAQVLLCKEVRRARSPIGKPMPAGEFTAAFLAGFVEAPTAAALAGFVEGARATWDVRFAGRTGPYW